MPALFMVMGIAAGLVGKLSPNKLAKGFIAGLDLMTGGLKKKNVLVLGCGAVGRAATQTLIKQKAIVAMARKLAGHLWTMLIKDQPYDPTK